MAANECSNGDVLVRNMYQQNYLLFWLFIIFYMIPPKLVLANRNTQQLYENLVELQPPPPQLQTVYNKGARKQQKKMKSKIKNKNKAKKTEFYSNRVPTPLFAKTEGWTVESSGSRDSRERSSPFSSPRNFKTDKYFKSSKYYFLQKDKINIEDDNSSPTKYTPIKSSRKTTNIRFDTPRSRLFTEQQLYAIQKSIQLQPLFQQQVKSIYISSKVQMIWKFVVQRQWIKVSEDPTIAEVGLFGSKQEYQRVINKKSEQLRKRRSLVNYLPINERDIITSLFLLTEGKHSPSMIELTSLSDPSSLDRVFQVGSMWMLKPRVNANYSNSSIITSKQQLLQKMKGLSRKNLIRQFILQRYITELCLYEKRKFTMKQIILVAHINQIFKGFLCEDLIIETASLEFAAGGYNPCAHFTDQQLQRQSKLYSKYEKDNLLTPKEVDYFLQKSNSKFTFEDVRGDMREVSIQFIKTVHNLMNRKSEKENHFQIFQVSYILRDDGKPILTDITSEPNLKPKHLPKLWQKCLQNILSLTLDVFIAPPASYFSRHRPQLRSRCFEMIFDSRINDYQQQGNP